MIEINISGWATFWLYMIMMFLIDTWVFLKGYDTFYWKHKTPNEFLIQMTKIENTKKETPKN